MAIPEMSGGSKGGMGMSDVMSILDQVPKVDYNPAPVAQAATPDFNAQLSSFYGDDPMKITQPYQDYYKSFPLPGDESKPAPAPVSEDVVEEGRMQKPDPSEIRTQGQNMDFVNPMVGTVELPDIAPGAFRYGGGTMEDFEMGGGFFPRKISRPVPQPERRDDGLINRPSPSRIQTAFDDPRGAVPPPETQINMGLGRIGSIGATPRIPMNEQPPINLINTGGFSTGGMFGSSTPQMPILDAAPKPKGRVATRKKKKRTVRRGGGRRLS